MATLEPKKYYNIILNENDKIEISKMIKEKLLQAIIEQKEDNPYQHQSYFETVIERFIENLIIKG